VTPPHADSHGPRGPLFSARSSSSGQLYTMTQLGHDPVGPTHAPPPPYPLSRARLVWAPTELGTDFALFPNLTCPGNPISTSLHDADHGPLRELPAPATAGRWSLDPGGFSRYSKSDRLGKKQATHIFQTLQGRHTDRLDPHWATTNGSHPHLSDHPKSASPDGQAHP
jgi:hypothetical protein